MTLKEFSDQFDLLYNSISSNQAPGLDEYEKSVFLTKAQEEIVKSYFYPITNKLRAGFDGNELRQIDFSTLVKSKTFQNITLNGQVDMRPNTKHVSLVGDDNESLRIMMILDEFVSVRRNGSSGVRLTVVPLDYREYSRLMSKPQKRPLRDQAWRLLNSSTSTSYGADLVIGPSDSLESYHIRYVMRPTPIILDDVEKNLTIDGVSGPKECTLDPVVHDDILQRAVELASAVYKGDLNSQISIGTASQTNLGILQTSNK